MVAPPEISTILETTRPDVVLDLTENGATSALSWDPPYAVWRMMLSSAEGKELKDVAELREHRGIVVVRMIAARPEAAPLLLCEAVLPVSSRRGTISMLTEATVRWPARCLAWVQIYGSLPARSSSVPLPQRPSVTRFPHSPQAVRIASLRTASRELVSTVRHLACHIIRSDVWRVGIAHTDIAAFVQGDRQNVTWLPQPGRSSQYHADPFGLVTETSTTILAERFDYSTGRGTLQSLTLSPCGCTQWSADLAISSADHISYPYLIHDGDTIYCIPETHQSREIALYRATHFALEWEKDTILVHNFAGVDPTIIKFNDRLWLFATDRDQGPDAVLCAWWSDEMRGPWRPHAGNPIKVDVRSSRPGGTPFVSHGRLLRPAQDNSESYGARLVVNMVTALSPTRFAEETIAIVEPSSSWPFRRGIHTIAAVGNMTIFDAKRLAFVPVASREKTVALVRRRFRRATSARE